MGCECESRISSCMLFFSTLAFLAVNWGRWCKRTCMDDSGFLASSVAVRLFCNEQKEQTVGRVFGRVHVPSLLGQLLPFRARLSIRAHMLTQDGSSVLRELIYLHKLSLSVTQRCLGLYRLSLIYAYGFNTSLTASVTLSITSLFKNSMILTVMQLLWNCFYFSMIYILL